MKLILLPGMDGTGSLFAPLLNKLNSLVEVTVIAYPQEIEQSYESLINWVLPKLPKHEEFVILGESFSGVIAFNIATKKIPNLIGVIFVATFLESPRPFMLRFEALLPFKLLLKLRLPDFLVRKFLLGRNADTSLISMFWESVRSVKSNVFQKRLSSVASLTQVAENVDICCSYIGGLDDCLVPNRCIEAFRDVCANLTEHFLPGPHFLLQAETEVCVGIIKEEIKRFSN